MSNATNTCGTRRPPNAIPKIVGSDYKPPKRKHVSALKVGMVIRPDDAGRRYLVSSVGDRLELRSLTGFGTAYTPLNGVLPMPAEGYSDLVVSRLIGREPRKNWIVVARSVEELVEYGEIKERIRVVGRETAARMAAIPEENTVVAKRGMVVRLYRALYMISGSTHDASLVTLANLSGTGSRYSASVETFSRTLTTAEWDRIRDGANFLFVANSIEELSEERGPTPPPYLRSSDTTAALRSMSGSLPSAFRMDF